MDNQRKPLAAVNITPLVDVLLILLVVVLLAMPMFVKRLPVDLPQTDLAGAPVVAKTLSVSLLESGQLMVEMSPVSMDDLARRIKPDTSIELSVDREVRYEQIAKTIADLQKKNPRDIALVTR
jgi:biopolymer transport protein ExbD